MKHPKVLVVEDDPAYQRILEIYIHRAGGNCDCLFDGVQALKKVFEYDYDLLFFDINIPGLDGIMLAKLLRERGCETPLIAITALKLESLERNAMEVGFNEYFQKPISEDNISSLFEKYHCGCAEHKKG